MLSAALMVTANSDIAAKVYALRVFGYSFIYDPEDYQTADIEVAWSAHEKFLGLPQGHHERETLISEIERIGRLYRI